MNKIVLPTLGLSFRGIENLSYGIALDTAHCGTRAQSTPKEISSVAGDLFSKMKESADAEISEILKSADVQVSAVLSKYGFSVLEKN